MVLPPSLLLLACHAGLLLCLLGSLGADAMKLGVGTGLAQCVEGGEFLLLGGDGTSLLPALHVGDGHDWALKLGQGLQLLLLEMENKKI